MTRPRPFKGSLSSESNEVQYWQVGKSVAGINKIEPVATIIEDFYHAFLQQENSISHN